MFKVGDVIIRTGADKDFWTDSDGKPFRYRILHIYLRSDGSQVNCLEVKNIKTGKYGSFSDIGRCKKVNKTVDYLNRQAVC